jgi:hypothetical protein
LPYETVKRMTSRSARASSAGSVDRSSRTFLRSLSKFSCSWRRRAFSFSVHAISPRARTGNYLCMCGRSDSGHFVCSKTLGQPRRLGGRLSRGCGTRQPSPSGGGAGREKWRFKFLFATALDRQSPFIVNMILPVQSQGVPGEICHLFAGGRRSRLAAAYRCGSPTTRGPRQDVTPT